MRRQHIYSISRCRRRRHRPLGRHWHLADTAGVAELSAGLRWLLWTELFIGARFNEGSRLFGVL